MTQPVHNQALILLVDDNQDDAVLVARAFHRAGMHYPLWHVANGNEAIAYLAGERPYDDRLRHPLPGLVLLDIKMPRTDGFDVLRWICRQPDFASLPVVMLTSSDEIRDVNQAYHLGANSFLVKPLDFWNAGDLKCSIDKLMAKTALHFSSRQPILAQPLRDTLAA